MSDQRTTRAQLEALWQSEMECAYDVLPGWWWVHAERQSRMNAWVDAEMAAQEAAGGGSNG